MTEARSFVHIRRGVTRILCLHLALALALTASPGFATTALAPQQAVSSQVVSADQPTPRRCVTDSGAPCPRNAKQSRKMFKAGKLGRTHVTKKQWPIRLKRMVKRAAIRKGYVKDPRHPGAAAQRGGRTPQSWRDFFDGLNNLVDCVAPGAESSCAKDFDHIKKLERPTKVALKCGGTTAMILYSGGTATAALGGGLFTCYWVQAWEAWE